MTAPQPPIQTQPINRLQFDILTGDDDLRADSTATVSVLVNGAPVSFQLKSGDDHSWDNNTEHVKTFELPTTVPLSALSNVTITLQSHNSFPETDDNWNIQSVRVTPMLSSPNPTAGFPDTISYATCVDVSGDPFVRLTGDKPSVVTGPFTGCPSIPPVSTKIDQVSFTIVTGGDDLRGDSSATLVMLVSGQPNFFTLKSESEAGWDNNTTHTKIFSLGTPQAIGAVGPITIALQSHVNFPETGDNWNIQSVVASLSNGGQNATCYVNATGNPFARLTGERPSVLILAFTGCAATAPRVIDLPAAALDSTATGVKFFMGVSDGHLWERYWNATKQNWAWTDHGTPPGTAVAGSPTVLFNSADTGLKLMLIAANGHVFEHYWSTAESNWGWTDHGTPLGTKAVTGPGAAIDTSPAVIKFFVGGADGHLWENYWNATVQKWEWTDHGTPPGTTVVGAPGALFNSAEAGGLKFMMRTANGHIFERYWNQAASNWGWTDHGTPPGTSVSMDPVVALDASPTVIKFFVGGADRRL
jgi:hypothetical protein